MHKVLLVGLISGLFFSFPVLAQQIQADPSGGELSWALDDSGVVECPGRFIALGLGACLPGGIDLNPLGGRRCAMGYAVAMATQGQCLAAFEMAKATACHNGGGEAKISTAGMQAVCGYLTSLAPR